MEGEEKITMTHLLVASGVLLLGVCFMVLVYTGIEQEYQKNTPTEVKTKHLANIEELKTITRGDLVEMTNGDLFVVVNHNHTGSDIHLERLHGGIVILTIEKLSRRVKRIVKQGNPDWPETAKKFLRHDN